MQNAQFPYEMYDSIQLLELQAHQCIIGSSLPLKYFGKSCVFLEKALDISHLLIYNGKAVQEHMLL